MAIRINVGTLKEGNQVLDFISNSREIGLEDTLLKDKLNISIDLNKVSHQIDMRISLDGLVNLICDRCLEVYEKKLKSEFELVFVQKSSRENSFDDGYVKTFSPFMKTIDITEDIREYVLLSIPMKHLPPENKDGTCSWCGKTKKFWKNYIKEIED
jgi:uncharacterized protein